MMYKLKVSYDGTHYFGWQKTKTGPSIQESLEHALGKISGEKVIPEAASRTDRGVHAEGQIVAFSLQKEWEANRLLRGMNAVLPRDIRVRDVEIFPDQFHPTLDAKEKEYHYRLCLGDVQEPMNRLYSWHYRFPVDVSLMEAAAKDLVGKNDFSALANEAEENPICHLRSIAFVPLERQRLQIVLRGDRFLYKMARNLAGTLLYIGSGKIGADCIPALLASKDRTLAGMTAPAHALFLHRVEY